MLLPEREGRIGAPSKLQGSCASLRMTAWVGAYLEGILSLIHGGNVVFDVEDVGVGGGEEFFVEGAEGFVYVFFVDHEAHVDFAGALRDHAHVDVGDSGEDLAGDAGLAADVFAN